MLWVLEKITNYNDSLLKRLVSHTPTQLIENISTSNLKSKTPKNILINLDSLDAAASAFEILPDLNKNPLNHVLIFSKIHTEINSQPTYNHHLLSLNNLLDLLKLDAKEDKQKKLLYKNLEYDCENFSLRILPEREQTQLPLKEAQLLKLFLQSPHRCLSREDIIKKVWNNIKVSPRTIDSHISRLRKKITYSHVLIENKYGSGYTLT